MRDTRTVVTTLAAIAALAVPAAAPAATKTVKHPDTGASFGVLSITTPDTSSGVYLGASITQTAQGQNLGNPLSTTTTNMSLECGAVATGAVATAIRKCYLKGLFTGVEYHALDTGAKPGAADAEGNFHNVLNQPYDACVETRVFLRDSETVLDAPLRCART